MGDLFILFVVFVFSVLIGSCATDSETFHKCATKGKSTMIYGGQIKCEIIKEKE